MRQGQQLVNISIQADYLDLLTLFQRSHPLVVTIQHIAILRHQH